MKYLAIFLISILTSAQPFDAHSTVVHVQSSKGKHIQAAKVKPVKKVGARPGSPKKKLKSDNGMKAFKICTQSSN